MILATFQNTFKADSTGVEGPPADRHEIYKARDGHLPSALCLQVEYRPVGAAPSGTTIAFGAKVQHSTSGLDQTWEDVPSFAITAIAVGTRASASKMHDLRAVALYRFVRIVGTTSITGTPNYQTGTICAAELLGVG